MDYEWQLRQTQKISKKTFKSRYKYQVLSKKKDLCEVKFNLLSYDDEKYYLIGPFNNWTLDLTKLRTYEFKKNGDIQELIINIKHNTPYKILKLKNNQKQIIQDPSTVYFDDKGNSVFWDFENDQAYKQKYGFVNIKGSVKILQTDLYGLVSKYFDGEKYGSQISKSKTYSFIKKSGVIKKIKELGFNAIQFLPFAQSIDGDNWKYRYLVPFQFALQKNWGTPDEFKEMIDEFHKHKIAVIGDFVVSHFPYKDYKIFNQTHHKNGLHVFTNKDKYVYFDSPTHWGTIRMNFLDKNVREFFQESVFFFQNEYKIDGFRIDNVDGIIRHGKNGDGEERLNGRLFLRELNKKLYDYNPLAIIHYEAHYYFGSNARWLVAPLNSNSKALGATAYNSSRITYYFHTDYMLKSGDQISTWKFKHINDEKEWGKSNSTIADFHNHDAAAGLMPHRATGSYAYDSMTHQKPHNHFHALGKIKVMEAIISFTLEGRTLNLLQTFLLQKGTFEHESQINWDLLKNENSKNLVNYKKKVNEILDDVAFSPKFAHNRKYLNVDEQNKILVVERKSDENSYIVIINLTSASHQNYKVGVTTKNEFEIIFNSDKYEYAGSSISELPNIFKNSKSNSFETLDREIQIPNIAPYQIIVLKEIN